VAHAEQDLVVVIIDRAAYELTAAEIRDVVSTLRDAGSGPSTASGLVAAAVLERAQGALTDSTFTGSELRAVFRALIRMQHRSGLTPGQRALHDALLERWDS
jgi:hypothetical protein